MPRLNIHLSIEKQKRKKDPLHTDIVGPTMLPDDEYIPKGLQMDFYRGDTEPNPNATPENGEPEWRVVPEWCGLPETHVTTAKFQEDSTGRYRFDQVDFTYEYVKNDFRVPDSVIETEYSSDNPDRWNRQPLASLDISEGQYGRPDQQDLYEHWTLCDSIDQDYSRVNVRCTLKKKKKDETSHKYDVSPDLLLDGDQKGRWKYREGVTGGTDEEPLQYKTRPSSPGKYGIQIQEVGTKSFFHYLYQSDFIGGGPIGYTASWSDPEGIFYSPFDTTDTNNFKVTRQPSYSADAVSGLLLDLKRKQKVQLYLMPRRWAYFKHHTTDSATTDLGDVLVTDICQHSRSGSILTEPYLGCPTGDVFNWIDECNWQTNCNFVDIDTFGGEVVDCSGTCTDGDTHWSISLWCCVTRSGTVTYEWVGPPVGCSRTAENDCI